MARHSRWDKMRAAGAELTKRPESMNATAPGWGLSLKPFQWVRYAHPVPYLFRGWFTFWDAVQEWAVDSYSAKAEDGTCLDFLHRRVPLKKDAAKKIGKALGVWKEDYRAGEAALCAWVAEAKRHTGHPENVPVPDEVTKDPRLGVAMELERFIKPLLLAKEDPRKFFAEYAPKAFPGAFDTRSPRFSLVYTLQQWGISALLNPSIRVAFDEAADGPPEGLLFILAHVEFADAYFEGKRGQDKGRRKLRVDNMATKAAVWREANAIEAQDPFHKRPVSEAVERVARKGGTEADVRKRRLTPSAVKRRMARASKRSR